MSNLKHFKMFATIITLSPFTVTKNRMKPTVKQILMWVAIYFVHILS